ncbi:hypothetical protein OP10G_1591 [Fimbriimonas ginsengisoli Gsoil 348]|uniref:Uncharacterized protein n=1 Tax=Fimbriimonas ginsengisoli Gsoil 348 TaxID=661478 RepID=A0A068NTM3_FIMGI|nr:hypothetical protein OP10G_1591 [Fimbriimonas ginsengisoli Gsoil 348]
MGPKPANGPSDRKAKALGEELHRLLDIRHLADKVIQAAEPWALGAAEPIHINKDVAPSNKDGATWCATD